MKKVVITILGTEGALYNKKLDRYEDMSMKNRASYNFNNKKLVYHNTFPLLIEFYSNEYDIVAIYTKESKQAQESILQQYDIEYNFDNKYYIANPNDNKRFFSIVNSIIKGYDKVIFDVSHGFRHLPLLALISLIVENIENSDKIQNIFFAQEKEAFKQYKLIDLKEYLTISNLALVLRSFLSTYKVPDVDLDEKLYYYLKDFSYI